MGCRGRLLLMLLLVLLLLRVLLARLELGLLRLQGSLARLRLRCRGWCRRSRLLCLLLLLHGFRLRLDLRLGGFGFRRAG